MFSGIVEAKVTLLEWMPENQIVLQKPSHFEDLHIGDSLAVNGVCLTLEWQDENSMRFALGSETINITGWTETELRKRPLNVERSLRLGDRLHGHVMAGHVDAVGAVHDVKSGSSCNITVIAPLCVARLIWKKGSLAVNGVSLTINDVRENSNRAQEGLLVSFCLIPETLKQTNLGDLNVGDRVTLEGDAMARAWVRQFDFLADEQMRDRRSESRP